MLVTIKVDFGSYGRFDINNSVKRGELLGLSPHFDDQVVLSPIDGIIERIRYDTEERAVLISIRRHGGRWQVAHP